MLRAAFFSFMTVIVPIGAFAQSAILPPVAPADVAALFEAVGMEENFNILAEIGVQDAAGLEDSLFPGRGGPAWRSMLEGLYEVGTLRDAFMESFPQARMSPEDTASVTAFYSTQLGQRIVDAELLAWREIARPEIEVAANEAYFRHLEEGSPRLFLLREFTQVNGFVDRNVSGALNSNYAFYRGMSDAGAYADALPEALMLNEVWGQEPEIRESTVVWLYSFQLMAYAGLSDAEVATYTAFSETRAARAFNGALFAGFDGVFEVMSYRLGTAAALFMSGENL